MNKMNIRGVVVLASVGIAGLLSGCDKCADLDERMCKDLGAEDCAFWKENAMTFTDQAENDPGGGRRSGLKRLLFGAGSSTCDAASNDVAYPQILAATKQSVAAMRVAEQAKAAAGVK